MTVADPQHGYLLLADITGYTSYVATTELTHSQEILAELLECIIDCIKPRMTISKIEGDAVFSYAPESIVSRGESLLELIESTYVAFRLRRDATQRRTTCSCNACRNIPSLDLKFFAHHGEYLVQSISNTRELLGSDVNLIHRLTKNQLTRQTGWRAYAMFTRQALSHFAAPLEGLLEQIEAYEHLGEVHTFSMDLHGRYNEIMDARRVVITPAEAHLKLEYVYQAPPAVVWEWFNDPHKRSQWMTSDILPVLRVRGRSGAAGARNHCVHGNRQVIVEDVLDIKPYEYVTVRHTPQGARVALEVIFRFDETEAGKTHCTLLFKGVFPYMPDWFKKQFCRFVVRTRVLPLWKLESINRLLENNQEVA